ncbi:MAG TPA: glycosyltransferase family 39 protein [candidate division Zixibacteria bacterium]|nr:glycosyltransferase family 39 protein [candidate division Zixibacteria bacterium]
MSRRTALWLMVLCILVAAALRLPDLVENPPGLHYDEAANGILAGDIGIRGERPIFIPSYTGKEPLFFYFAGSLMRLIGESVFALRMTAALMGIVTVAATYWVGKELLADRRIALLAAALLAVSFWHVLFSRLGFRAVSQPLMQALAVAALFHGFRRDSRIWLALAGVVLGLSAYTYLAVRFFPIPLALAMLPLLFTGSERRRRLGQLALFAVTALVVLSPLVVYFISNPDAFWVRAGQVFPDQNTGTTIVESYWKSLGMLFVDGDPYWRFNIPNRPIFDWFIGLMLVAGWILALVRLVRSRIAVERSAYLLLLLVPPFLLLPTALAADDIVPSNLRAIGLLPFVLFLPAAALDAGIDFLRRQIQVLLNKLGRAKLDIRNKRYDNAIAIGIILIFLAAGAVTIVRTYYQEWSLREDVFYDTDADLVAVSDYLSGIDIEGETIYLAAEHYRHPTVAFLSDKYEQIKWLPDSGAFVQPAEGSAIYIFPRSSPAPDWTLPYLSDGNVTAGPDGPDGDPVFSAYFVPAPYGHPIANPVNVNFNNSVTLLGYEIGRTDSGTVPLKLVWRVDESGTRGLQPFVHLDDAWGYRWSQLESFAYPAEQWTPGDVVIQQLELPVKAGTPPGSYQLRIGFFDTETGEQLVTLNEGGQYAGDALTIDGVPIPTSPYSDPLPDPRHLLNVSAGPNLTLIGYDRPDDSVASGASFWMALWWNATGDLTPASTRLELVGPDNTGSILMGNILPVHGTYPFENWQYPQLVIDHMSTRVPENIEPGEYILRLRLLDQGDKTISTADLGTLIIEEADRLYNPPKTTFPMKAVFGDEIELTGYDLESTGSGKVKLRLVWQALKEPTSNYTVFVHVLNQDGSCCAWQQDIQPGQGSSPTGSWLTGEVTVDEYEIVMPVDAEPGQYQIEIGFYIPSTARRLLVDVPDMRQSDSLILTRPLILE